MRSAHKSRAQRVHALIRKRSCQSRASTATAMHELVRLFRNACILVLAVSVTTSVIKVVGLTDIVVNTTNAVLQWMHKNAPHALQPLTGLLQPYPDTFSEVEALMSLKRLQKRMNGFRERTANVKDAMNDALDAFAFVESERGRAENTESPLATARRCHCKCKEEPRTDDPEPSKPLVPATKTQYECKNRQCTLEGRAHEATEQED